MEPERRIEKWLRAFAKKRREQAGDSMELRPAARQRLQREIARRAEEKSRGWFANLFFGLRPGLAFAVCFIALAIIGGVLLKNFNRPQPASLSMAKLPESEMILKDTSTAPTTPPVSVAAPTVVQEKKALADKRREITTASQPAQPTEAAANREPANAPSELAKGTDRARSTFDLSSTVTETLPPSSNAMFAFKNESMTHSLVAGGELNQDADGALPPLKPQSTVDPAGTTQTFAMNTDESRKTIAQSATTTSGAANATFFDDTKNSLAATPPAPSQLFNRLETPTTRRALAGAASAPSPVLVSFRVEQNGNALKVVDADGSVYTGSVQLAQKETDAVVPAGTPKSAMFAARIPDGHALSPAAQNYFFRVAGTNRNLNQNVIFSGNFIPLTNAQYFTNNRGFGGGGFGGARRDANQLQIETLLSNSRITGKAVINNQKEIEVNATPAP